MFRVYDIIYLPSFEKIISPIYKAVRMYANKIKQYCINWGMNMLIGFLFLYSCNPM